MEHTEGVVVRTALALLLAIVTSSAIAETAPLRPSCDRSKQISRSSASASTTQAATPISQEVIVYCGSNGIGSAPSSPGPTDKERGPDWARLFEAFFKLLGSLSWPVAVYMIARHFKAELAALLARLKKVKAGSAEAEFERGVDEASQAANIPPVDPEPEVAAPAVKAAAADPRGSILGAWLEVEKAVFRLCEARHLNVPSTRVKLGVLPAMKAIQSANALDPNYVGLFHDLRSLRNAAAHNYDFNPEPEAVMHYAKLARSLAKAIEDAARAA